MTDATVAAAAPAVQVKLMGLSCRSLAAANAFPHTLQACHPLESARSPSTDTHESMLADMCMTAAGMLPAISVANATCKSLKLDSIMTVLPVASQSHFTSKGT